MPNFERVKALVGDGKLRIISVLAASRTISTALSKSISAHPGVHAEVIQPFHLRHPYSPATDAQRDEAAYGFILKAYDEAARQAGDRPVTVIVAKEMARNLMNPKALSQWDSLSGKHILTIRNPLLALESTMRIYFNFIEEEPEGLERMARQFAEAHGHEATPEYLRSFPHVYAKSLGYEDKGPLSQHWGALVDYATTHREYGMLGPLLEEFFPFYDLNSRSDAVKRRYIDLMTDETAKLAGYASLNAFAKRAGYRNWNDFKQKQLQDGNIEAFSPLLEKVFATSNTGWEGFRNLLLSLSKSNGVIIVDGSILRGMPETAVETICEHLGLNREDGRIMINWEGAPEVPVIEDAEPAYRGVFARAQASTKLELPTETPVPLSRLPEQFQRHFSEVALPVYLEALSDDRCIRPRGKEALKALLHMHAGNKTLQDIDPVWAYSLISTDKAIARDEKERMLGEVRHSETAGPFGDVLALIDENIRRRRLKRAIGQPAPGKSG